MCDRIGGWESPKGSLELGKKTNDNGKEGGQQEQSNKSEIGEVCCIRNGVGAVVVMGVWGECVWQGGVHGGLGGVR